MAVKKKTTNKTIPETTLNQENKILKEQLSLLKTFASNETFTLRRELIQQLTGSNRDIDTSCGYPLNITAEDYHIMFERLGIATRIIELWPEECWKESPQIYENEDLDDNTDFELAWNELVDRLPIWNLLYRADVLSGIGRYGVIFLGLDDGLSPSEPAYGINEYGESLNTTKERKLLFAQPFSEIYIKIDSFEKDITNPRYGFPEYYNLKFSTEGGVSNEEIKVHWTRIIHLADNRTNSEVFGTPRLKRVYNHLLDTKKISGGSGEMFWRGGFPGYSFELSPKAQELNTAGMTETQKTDLKEQMRLYAEGMQRMLYLGSITMKDHSPQVADPSGHLDWHIKLIALALGVPYRVLIGTEEAKLAGNQDKRAWNERVQRRRLNYLEGMVLKPFINRLIGLGCLPIPSGYIVDWPELDTPTEADIAETANKVTDALSKYVSSDVSSIFPLKEYLTMILKKTKEESESIENAAFEQIKLFGQDGDENNDDD